jgi:hypothetical protein
MKPAPEYFMAQVHRPISVVVTEVVLQQKYRLVFRKNSPGNHADFAEMYFLQHPEPGTEKPQRNRIIVGFDHTR